MTPAQRFTTITRPRARLGYCFGVEALIAIFVLALGAGFLLGWQLAGRLL